MACRGLCDRNERLDTLLDGHERALRHSGGVPLSCPYDNPRNLTLGRSAGQVLWHPRFEDFARYVIVAVETRIARAKAGMPS